MCGDKEFNPVKLEKKKKRKKTHKIVLKTTEVEQKLDAL
jgi:hypothetical protein